MLIRYIHIYLKGKEGYVPLFLLGNIFEAVCEKQGGYNMLINKTGGKEYGRTILYCIVEAIANL